MARQFIFIWTHRHNINIDSTSIRLGVSIGSFCHKRFDRDISAFFKLKFFLFIKRNINTSFRKYKKFSLKELLLVCFSAKLIFSFQTAVYKNKSQVKQKKDLFLSSVKKTLLLGRVQSPTCPLNIMVQYTMRSIFYPFKLLCVEKK